MSAFFGIIFYIILFGIIVSIKMHQVPAVIIEEERREHINKVIIPDRSNNHLREL